MSRNRKEKKKKAVPVGIGILVFILAFGVGVVSKFAIQPSWAKEYSVKWSDEVGTLNGPAIPCCRHERYALIRDITETTRISGSSKAICSHPVSARCRIPGVSLREEQS